MSSSTTADPIVDRPQVAQTQSYRTPILFGLVLAVAAGGLFAGLEARRGEITAPATRPMPDSGAGLISAPPPLVIPNDASSAAPFDYAQASMWPNPTRPTQTIVPRSGDLVPSSQQPTTQRDRGPAYSSAESYPQYEPSRQAEPGSGVVYQAPSLPEPANRAENGDGKGAERVEATKFTNPGTTVPKGAIIQAVLETALDSNRAGPARAIISRDVRGFDGARILIPRGSRLYGEYKSDLGSGQNRALIQWQRLMRPDGAVIDLDSPSADPLGRAGVKGKVNTHFFERFGGAILQSTLDIGVALATRSVTNGTVIIGLPGATVPQVMGTSPDQIKPTLKVKQGTAVSVFVARDLDFTKVER